MSEIMLLAATVLMLRDTEAGPEVFMIKRHQEMGFAAGALVFPGGRLDEADGDERRIQLCAGGETLRAAERAMRVCAIRETFEESGVLLAHVGDAPDLVSGERARDLQQRYRDNLNAGETSIWEMAAAENLKLACASLTPFAHWITPEFRPLRFDTRFYLAVAPEGQEPTPDGVETMTSFWTTPAHALAGGRAGRWDLMMPTRLNLERLGRSASVAEALATARGSKVVTVTPWIERRADGAVLRIPDHAGYGEIAEPVGDRR